MLELRGTLACLVPSRCEGAVIGWALPWSKIATAHARGVARRRRRAATRHGRPLRLARVDISGTLRASDAQAL
jgi:hypothetical protein